MEMTLAGKQVANGWLPGAASATTLIIRDITRRKKTEAALLESEAKANALIKYAPTGIYEIDFRGPRIVSANDAMSLLSGYSHEELLTMDPNMLLEPESRKLFAERAKRTLAGEALSDSVEYQVRKKDGTVIDVIVNASFPKDKPYMAFVVGYDITQRKKIEQALRETSAYLDNLFNYANAPIIVWNPGFEITRFNHAFEHLTGLMTDEAIGKKLEILFPEQTRGQSMDLIRRTAAGEKWESVEIPILRRDGTVRTVLWNSATIYSEAGKTPLATIAQGQDITGRKKAEDELKESEARFRSVLDNSQDVIVRFNLQTGSYEYVSPSVADLTGYSPEEYMAMDKKSALDMIHPEDFSQFTSAMEASVQTGKAAIEYRQKTKNGAYIWVSNHMAVIRDAEGRPLFRDSNIHDVTARRQAEQALRETNKELKRFNDVAVGRELRMIELKKEINRLSLMCGDEPPYPSVSNEDAP
jgi:PAS domain S-box-containing protein